MPQSNVAPSFADDTGEARTWTQNAAIPAITVPEADGTPTPTYAVESRQVLPAGIAFNTGTRVISGTPNAVGNGTITIRATNSEGTADWTVDLHHQAPAPVAPNFADDTGNAQTLDRGRQHRGNHRYQRPRERRRRAMR